MFEAAGDLRFDQESESAGGIVGVMPTEALLAFVGHELSG